MPVDIPTDTKRLLILWANLNMYPWTSYQYDDTRLEVQKRLSKLDLLPFINSYDPEIKHSVAENINIKYLPLLINDESKEIRMVTVKRIEERYLPQMINDKDLFVRYIVAERIDKENAVLMWATDPDKIVRNCARKRVLGK
jgi:hypothetical protein